jgi:hypothetical protein
VLTEPPGEDITVTFVAALFDDAKKEDKKSSFSKCHQQT